MAKEGQFFRRATRADSGPPWIKSLIRPSLKTHSPIISLCSAFLTLPLFCPSSNFTSSSLEYKPYRLTIHSLMFMNDHLAIFTVYCIYTWSMIINHNNHFAWNKTVETNSNFIIFVKRHASLFFNTAIKREICFYIVFSILTYIVKCGRNIILWF